MPRTFRFEVEASRSQGLAAAIRWINLLDVVFSGNIHKEISGLHSFEVTCVVRQRLSIQVLPNSTVYGSLKKVLTALGVS